MHPGSIGNVPDILARIGIQHDHMRAPRNIKMPRAGVDGEVIPPAFPAQLVGFDYVISRTSRSDRDRCQGQAEYGNPPLRIESHDFLLINLGAIRKMGPRPIARK